ncbi:hypothetical protein [Pseudomonas sp. LFM046]|uniref:DUF7375 domain-containing protein n=1 Tax=Pseudomonas sp. LFM046 TaxID=1608357 RepID=UPI0011AFAF25|nr:hypothetical protein [Pseudomonas sp. LFM046]
MTDTKLTSTHRKYFLAFVQDAVRGAHASTMPTEKVEEFLTSVNLQPVADELGKAILSKVSYSQVKAVDKFMNSADYLAVMDAIAHALTQFTIPRATEVENVQ